MIKDLHNEYPLTNLTVLRVVVWKYIAVGMSGLLFEPSGLNQ